MSTVIDTNIDASGIAVGSIRDEYQRRGVAEWSDVQLAAAVAEVISIPRRDPADSFILHSALELEARLALLPHVSGADRDLARLHVLAIAAQYEAFGPPIEALEGRPRPLRDGVDPIEWLSDALAAGDLDEVDRAAVALADARPRPDELAAALIDRIAPSTAAAGHAPIFLFHLGRVASRGEIGASLLRPLARELGRHPDWRIEWIDEHCPAAATSATELERTLSELPILGLPESSFIRPLMAQVDTSDEVVTMLGQAVGHHTADAARTIMRVAARSMLAEPGDHARYGWTHCLTMPQAVLGVAPFSHDPDRLLAIAATHVAGFRIAEATRALPPLDQAALSRHDPAALASAAATSHDAHIVKYVLACLDASAMDPEATALYLAGAQRLLDVWDDLGGDPTDPLAA